MERIILLGPSLAAVSGVSTHLNYLLNSSLSGKFNFIHFQVGHEGREEHVFKRSLRLFWSPIDLTRKIISVRAAIVHVNTSIDLKAFWRDLVYVLTAKILRRKVVYQIHGGKLPDKFIPKNVLIKSLLKFFFRIPDRVIVLGEIERKAYEDYVPNNSLTVVPNAIDLKPYTVSGKKFDKQRLNLVYIGRLTRVKGIFDIVDACQMLVNDFGINRIQLIFAGSGPDERNLRDYVQEKKLAAITTFLGPVFEDQKYRFWRDADIFVFPTFHQEGLPYSVLESIASGTPLVTTRVGCIPEVIFEGNQGFFVEPHSPASVAAVIKRMIDDQMLLRRVSEECVVTAQQNYGLDRLAAQFTELYEKILIS